MGSKSSRINTCTCELADTLVEPCHSEFLQGCLKNSPDLAGDDSCCETGTCVGLHQDLDNPVGQAAESSRQLLCNDGIPGNCAVGGVPDCCSKTCTECGLALDPFAKWSTCTAGNATAVSGDCGYVGYSPFTCDFSACEADHPWHPDAAAFQTWIQAVDPPVTPEDDAGAAAAPVPENHASTDSKATTTSTVAPSTEKLEPPQTENPVSPGDQSSTQNGASIDDEAVVGSEASTEETVPGSGSIGLGLGTVSSLGAALVVYFYL